MTSTKMAESKCNSTNFRFVPFVVVLLFFTVTNIVVVRLNRNHDDDRKEIKHSSMDSAVDTPFDDLQIGVPSHRGKRALVTSTQPDLPDLTATKGVGGAIYIRWGRTTCANDTNAELVYDGIAGGSHSTHEGGASNLQCLPHKPIWGKFDDTYATNTAYMYGAEYKDEMTGILSNANSAKLLHHNVPCAVCRSASRLSVVMIPARNVCYPGWQLEYHGYLMAGLHANKAASQYVCLDESPEADAAGHRDENGSLLYRVEAMCGSLPCPKYVNGRELTCVVCTK